MLWISAMQKLVAGLIEKNYSSREFLRILVIFFFWELVDSLEKIGNIRELAVVYLFVSLTISFFLAYNILSGIRVTFLYRKISTPEMHNLKTWIELVNALTPLCHNNPNDNPKVSIHMCIASLNYGMFKEMLIAKVKLY